MKKEQLSEDAYNHKLEYNQKYKKDNKNKINIYNRNYSKNNYKCINLRFKKEEEDKINKILKDKNISLKEYVMQKVEEDLK